MGDIDKKVKSLVDKINTELEGLGSRARFRIGEMITDDTNEKYSTVEIKIGPAPYMAYSSPNYVGIKTFLQGVYVSLTLSTGTYRLKPMSEFARRQIPESIIPRLCQQSVVAAGPSKRERKVVNARTHPRFAFQRTKYV